MNDSLRVDRQSQRLICVSILAGCIHFLIYPRNMCQLILSVFLAFLVLPAVVYCHGIRIQMNEHGGQDLFPYPQIINQIDPRFAYNDQCMNYCMYYYRTSGSCTATALVNPNSYVLCGPGKACTCTALPPTGSPAWLPAYPRSPEAFQPPIHYPVAQYPPVPQPTLQFPLITQPLPQSAPVSYPLPQYPIASYPQPQYPVQVAPYPSFSLRSGTQLESAPVPQTPQSSPPNPQV